MKNYQVISPENIPEIIPGDSLTEIFTECLIQEKIQLQDGDILVIAHKVVSKAENRIVHLREVVPSPEAELLAQKTGKDPALVELIIRESKEILWASKEGLLLCRHRLGYVCANAAVDCSNSGINKVVLLPENPDHSAAFIRNQMEKQWKCCLGVLICDTHGKPFRLGASGTVIGASGVRLLKNYIGHKDRAGYTMHSSVEAEGDEMAGAATLLLGQGDEGRPLAIIRGLSAMGDNTAADLIRNEEKDVFLTALKNAKSKKDG